MDLRTQDRVRISRASVGDVTTSTVLVVTNKTVQAGQTYFCEVTSVDSDGVESPVDGPYS
jgi:fibronectin type 3 domain-containing protein